jgi:hypothetical protein
MTFSTHRTKTEGAPVTAGAGRAPKALAPPGVDPEDEGTIRAGPRTGHGEGKRL